MIESVRIIDSKQLPVSWWAKTPSLTKIESLAFTPGLNIIWGKNGAGKSTILRLIAKMFHAEQGRFSTITQSSIMDLFPSLFANKKEVKLPQGVEIIHNGRGIGYYDPCAKVGLIGGSFDDDFYLEGIQSTMRKASSGQWTIGDVGGLWTKMEKKETFLPVWKMNKERVNSHYRKRLELVEEFFKSNTKDEQWQKEIRPTMLLDEPDRSLDMPNQVKLWKGLQIQAKRKYQIIAASHSPFALNLPEANYIEISDGYLNECLAAIQSILPPPIENAATTKAQ